MTVGSSASDRSRVGSSFTDLESLTHPSWTALCARMGLAQDVTDAQDMQLIGAHLDVDLEEATARDVHAGLVVDATR